MNKEPDPHPLFVVFVFIMCMLIVFGIPLLFLGFYKYMEWINSLIK